MWKKAIQTWLNDRTDYLTFLSKYRSRVLPDGPRWAYTTASTLFWMLMVEVVTGLLLMSAYSPSSTTAWGSVFYIEQLPGGAFIRALHYYASQALIILFACHMIRVLLHAAYRTPREIIWVSGMILGPLLIGLAITGNPLPGSHKSFAQIKVEGNIVGTTPIIGPTAQRILIGGDEVGNVAITHLNFLHVALLPLLIGLLTVLHLHQIYRHADFSGEEDVPSDAITYWPHQSIRNLSVFGFCFGIVVFLSLWYGAPMETPLNPDIHDIPRPEWYFLFLFELRGYFTGSYEYIATIIIPTLSLLLLLFLPAIDWVCSKKVSKILHYTIVFGGLIAFTWLTLASMIRDHNDEAFQASKRHMKSLAERAVVLAKRGIPPEGASAMLSNDPKTHGPVLFQKHCASCHSHTNKEGKGIAASPPSAPNLYNFATRNWIAGFLDPEKVKSTHYFGNTSFKEGSMSDGQVEGLSEKQISQVAMALSAEAKLKSQKSIDLADKENIAAGIKLIKNDERCISCHKFYAAGELGEAPELTNYGSREWLIQFIRNPAHARNYGYEEDGAPNDRMPVFADHPGDSRKNLLDQKSIELITDWLRGEWYEPENEENKE
ncbi:Ubiquinol--cytochrome c reductase, cytochrome B subunit [hydrothermal vent metagenome]|uniref:Ubiquinol--cytochrome c reductase, cytochrome B subunit n=1 Tax=hydrothermal vent metagenome TaxID=652676 RepID=A0A3B1DRS1_9ZZZZ